MAWTFEGPLDTTLERTSLKGRLSNGAGLAADIQLQRDAKTPLALSAKLAEVFFRTGNPLAATLADWPGLLELGNGARPPRPAGSSTRRVARPSTWT